MNGTTVRDFFRSSLGVATLPILLLLLIGTGAYMWIEGWSLLDALYATVITITTVGYGDFSPQTLPGRVFAIFFTLIAIGLAGYAISTLAAVVIEHELTKSQRRIEERRMNRIAQLTNHIIICGANILAHRAAAEFYRRDEPFIVIEEDEETLKWAMLWLHEGYVTKRKRHFDEFVELDFEEEQKSIAELADESGVLYLLGDPTDEQLLLRAGISRARGLVAALNDDRDNIAVVLSARDLKGKLGNASLRIVARVYNEWNMRRLYLAGADKVVSPNFVGGFQLATHILDPDVGDFWDRMLFQNQETLVRVVDVPLAQKPEWVGKTVEMFRQQAQQQIVAIKRNDNYQYAPAPDDRLEANDVLIVVDRAVKR